MSDDNLLTLTIPYKQQWPSLYGINNLSGILALSCENVGGFGAEKR